ncbi:hypothetical protein TWF730_003171 [Orbilia blumenaviensis]|uniref:Uncharacterized protein n=1 Tax=Orbilia blumenaviensis TaxID=1796055 RepID=A0AAV9U4J1_9PEZI
MVDISLDLLAGDPQYLNGHGLDLEARIETDESEKGENADRPGKGKYTGGTSSRAGLSQVGTLDFFQDNHQENPIEQASEVEKMSVFDMLGTYPQIFRVKRPIKLVDGQITSYSRSADIYWSIHIPWNGPCTPVKDIVESVAAAVTEEILEQNGELLGCWVRFSEYNFFPRADENDKVHPRWKVFLDLLVIKDPSSSSS